MASIKRYKTAKGTAWRVQYRSPDGKSRTKQGFATKKLAESWAADNTVSIDTGSWIKPEQGKTTVGELIDKLFTISEWKESWRARLETTRDTHVVPRWGTMPVTRVQQTDVRAWLAELTVNDYASRDAQGRWTGATKPMSGSSKRHCLTVLAGALDLAVTDRLIRTNPARGFPLPKKSAAKQIYLTSGQVKALATGSSQPDVVWTLATTGMRFGELAGLQVGDIDFAARRISIARNAVWVNNRTVVGTPKTDEGVRVITAPEFVFTMLKRRCRNKLPGAWVFSDSAEPMKRPFAPGHWFPQAVSRCLRSGDLTERVTLHDLRHTAASLMVQSGANVKVVQRQLGHASAAVTLDTYASLFDEDLDALRARMDEVAMTAG